jgi:hypothetical protein
MGRSRNYQPELWNDPKIALQTLVCNYNSPFYKISYIERNFKILEVCMLQSYEKYIFFFNILAALVIATSMERVYN